MVDFILLSSTDTNRIHVVGSTTIQRGVYIVCCEDTADIHESIKRGARVPGSRTLNEDSHIAL